ncbi:Leucine-rich repeat, cysteine-containing subtype [Corchorus olitorius]|uniref:Leucine-rich repeat, cysteine-containing subtype n=1 Tax=Corchorus olitorius TaxID=93759 RepID=A0A1R3KAK6_9ROSI|nr:Leucine-rich repeat, cysteine-containing subtype [Corchorus olitorius]
MSNLLPPTDDVETLLRPTDGVEALPSDCWRLVFENLSQDDLEAVSLTCKDFLTNSNLVKKSLNVIHPKVTMLSQHLKRFPQLKILNLSGFRGDLDEAMSEIACSGISLEGLELYKRYISISGVIDLGSNPKMKNLKTLIVTDITCLDDEDVVEIANLFPNLEELQIIGFELHGVWVNYPKRPFAGDSGIEYLASKLKLLRKIHFTDQYIISDRSIIALSVNCVFLKDVTISNHRVTEHGIGLLLQNRPNLEDLSLSHIRSSTSNITIENSISHAKALTSLICFRTEIPDTFLMEIAKAKLRLKVLQLNNCCSFTASGLLMVSSYLNELEIDRHFGILDAEMEILAKGDLGNLTHIQLKGCKMTSSTFLLLLTNCPWLVEIKMIESKVRGEVDDILLCKNHSIRNIDLNCRCKFSEALVKQFTLLFPNLNDLVLGWCHTFEGIHVAELILTGDEINSLEVLRVSNSSGIDGEAIAKSCPKLRSLEISDCKKVTIEGIKHIVETIKTLTCLNIDNFGSEYYGELLDWIISAGFVDSLKTIFVPSKECFNEEQRDEFLRRGCFLLTEWY